MKLKLKVKGRKVYGAPLAKRAGQAVPVPLPRDVLEEVGKAILDAVKSEARVEIAKYATRPTRDGGGDTPAYIRDMKAFLAMLKVRVAGDSSIEVYVSEGKRKKRVGDRLQTVHPYHHRFLSDDPKDHEPFVMDTLKSKVGKTVPLVELDGEVVFRVVVPNAAWVHPGFMKYTFLERGISKGRTAAVDIIRERVVVPLVLNGAAFQ
jgi:hypothetical protein